MMNTLPLRIQMTATTATPASARRRRMSIHCVSIYILYMRRLSTVPLTLCKTFPRNEQLHSAWEDFMQEQNLLMLWISHYVTCMRVQFMCDIWPQVNSCLLSIDLWAANYTAASCETFDLTWNPISKHHKIKVGWLWVTFTFHLM